MNGSPLPPDHFFDGIRYAVGGGIVTTDGNVRDNTSNKQL